MTLTTETFPVPIDLTAPTISQGVAQKLISMRAEILSWDETECAKFISGEKVMKEWAKLQQDSAAILAELERAKATALRRFGALGGSLTLLSSYIARRHAEYLGSLTVSDFDAFLERLIFPKTINQLIKDILDEKDEAEFENDYRQTFLGKKTGSGWPYPSRAEDLRRAAKTILADHLCGDETFTTSEVVERLAESLGMDEISTLEYKGLTTVVHDALTYETIDPSDDFPHATKIPAVVTYLDDEVGWVRVPFDRATVGQLRLMLEWRRAQLQSYKDAVANLESIMAAAESKCQGDDSRRLGKLAGQQLHRVIHTEDKKRAATPRKRPSRAAYARAYYAKKRAELLLEKAT